MRGDQAGGSVGPVTAFLNRFDAKFVFGFFAGTICLLVFVGWISAYSPTVEEQKECREAAKQAHFKAEECKTFWERSTSDPVAFFTIVLAGSTIGLWVSTGMLYRAGERQIRLVEASAFADQRPWISVNIEPVGPLIWKMENRSDDSNGIHIDCVISVSNTGKSPASNVQVRHRTSINNFIIDFSFFTTEAWGYTIFPGQSIRINETLVWHKSVGQYNIDNAHVMMPDGTIIPFIIGSVFYKDKLRGMEWHQTGFAFITRRAEQNGFLAIRREHGAIPQNLLSMRPWHDQGPTT